MSVVTTFGQIDDFEIVNAQSAFESLAEARIDASPYVGKANSYRCPLGAEAGKCFLFMRRRDLQNLVAVKGNTTDGKIRTHTLTLGVAEVGGPTKSISFPGLMFVRGWRLIPGESQDPKALYIVEFADLRWIAQKSLINKRFNCRANNSADSDFVEETTNSGTPWTWAQIAEQVWGEQNEFTNSSGIETKSIGTYSAVKIPTPTPAISSTPENLRYEGIDAYSALCDVLQRMGCTMRYDPINNEFRGVQLGDGTADSGATHGELPKFFKYEGGVDSHAAINKLSDGATTRRENDLLLEDAEVIVGRYLYPRRVAVHFPISHVSGDQSAPVFDKKGLYHVVEVEGDSLAIGSDGVYTSPADQTAPDTTVILHDQTPARFADVDDADPTNDSELNTRAAEVANAYYRGLVDDLPGRLVFSGIRKFIPGPFIQEVIWRDFGDGIKTEIVRNQPKQPEPQPRPPVVADNSGSGGGSDSGCGCCDVFNCADSEDGPGTSDLSEHCDACECGVEVWQIQVPSIICGTAQAGLTHELEFSEDDSTGDICIWTTGLFEDAGRTFEWRLAVEAGPVGQLQLIEFDDDGNAVWIAEWSCSEFCCKCENTLTASCPVYLPPCAGLPTSICLRPWSRTATVSCGDCEVMPPAYRLTISGVGGVGCAPDANGTFILRHRSFDPDLEDPDTCYCEWVSSFDSLPIWQLITNSGPLCSSGSNFRLQFITSGSESLVYDSVGFPDPENGNECLADIELALNLNQTNVCTPGPTTVTLEALEKIGEDCDALEGGCCVFLKWFGTGEGYTTGGTPVDPSTAGWRWVNVTQAQGNSQGCPAADECEECDLAGLPDPSSGAQPLYLVTGCAA